MSDKKANARSKCTESLSGRKFFDKINDWSGLEHFLKEFFFSADVFYERTWGLTAYDARK